MYLRQRPKSVNWESLPPRSSATVRLGNSLALGLQRGVNSISLQCIPWPVACSEWGACLTDFDRSSTLDFPVQASGLWSRSGSKVDQFVHVPTPVDMQNFIQIDARVFSNLANRQTDKHRGQSHILPSLSELNYTFFKQIRQSWYAILHTVQAYTDSPKISVLGRRNWLYRPPRSQREAQRSQRDRATLRVIEYVAKSLKVIRNNTVE